MALQGIEAELSREGCAFRESRGANRDELQLLVQEAIKAGMPVDAVAGLTGVPVGQIRELLNRE